MGTDPLLPVRRRHLDQELVANCAGVVDEHVDATDRLHHRLDLGRIADISLVRDRAGKGRRGFLGGGLVRAVVHDDLRAHPGQRLADGPTNALATPPAHARLTPPLTTHPLAGLPPNSMNTPSPFHPS